MGVDYQFLTYAMDGAIQLHLILPASPLLGVALGLLAVTAILAFINWITSIIIPG